MVADAVAVKPVSAPQFPANRENNREFCVLPTSSATLAGIQRVKSKALSEIPYIPKQGIIFLEQGILEPEQGSLPAEIESNAEQDFRNKRALGNVPSYSNSGQAQVTPTPHQMFSSSIKLANLCG